MKLIPPGPPAPWLLSRLGELVDWSTVLAGGTIVVLVFTNVVLRFFDVEIAWTSELSEVLMVWVTFLGGAAATRRGEHVAITEFADKLSAMPRRWLDGAIQLVCALVLLLLTWYGIGIAQASWSDRLTVLNWPMSVEYLALPVGSVAALAFVLFDLFQIALGRSRAERYGE
ncbi:MAG: TRAP transporter small permease [Betaproteobacteria bacterium]|nr:TRAP transporter small permease [Betaproteobacteria bacterium]MDE2003424.1 TRAP transporter small permease [Betaproteobacteria bacterium]MDE2208263.1 TRAP transporter small permease [Betaproteobacteria bacterium]MDE2359154.1 TRAP transporter small permease [Betaproteobacteria bacterium]